MAGTTTVYYYAGQQLFESEQYAPIPRRGRGRGVELLNIRHHFHDRAIRLVGKVRRFAHRDGHYGLDVQHGRRRVVESSSAPIGFIT